VRGYRSAITAHLLPAFGELPVEDVTPAVIEQWIAGFVGSTRTRNKLLIQLHGILGRAKRTYGLAGNAASEVEKFQQTSSGDIEVFSPEEIWAVVRAAEDAAVFLTAAFTGLRMGELLALRWRDVDFAGNAVRVRASYYLGHLTTPKSRKIRAVPLAPAVATALAQWMLMEAGPRSSNATVGVQLRAFTTLRSATRSPSGPGQAPTRTESWPTTSTASAVCA
jgi:integrase